MEIKYTTDYRNVKYPRLEFKTGDLLLVLPKEHHESEGELIEKHKDWINNKHAQIIAAMHNGRKKQLNMERDEEVFKDYVREMAAMYLKELKLNAESIRFRKMKSKWASCTIDGNITVNKLLRHLPNDLINYVIYHEVAHLKEKSHNHKFWNLVENKFKNVNAKEKNLLTYWFLLQKQIKG